MSLSLLAISDTDRPRGARGSNPGQILKGVSRHRRRPLARPDLPGIDGRPDVAFGTARAGKTPALPCGHSPIPIKSRSNPERGIPSSTPTDYPTPSGSMAVPIPRSAQTDTGRHRRSGAVPHASRSDPMDRPTIRHVPATDRRLVRRSAPRGPVDRIPVKSCNFRPRRGHNPISDDRDPPVGSIAGQGRTG